ncbi:MAG: 23S rRNA (guanosine(2251)-2'-O)-methyltransferase RlmB [Porticoccaceae bacterium]|nr:MAG: 23S rRNA (guanosine(2251)-2'-O)-methyltransferase RlmB [Porticoccaceae bacterium]
MTDTPEHLQRKRFYDRLLTIYGRKPVLEALLNPEIPCYRLHLADSNKPGGIIKQIITLAEQRGVEIVHHSRQALSRISRNSKQDQGVAADLECPNHQLFDDFIASPPKGNYSLIALDGITNPQNLGMIIRSVTASPCCGILLPQKGTAAISPLVIKASAGTLFKSTLIHCDSLEQALPKLKKIGAQCCTLSSHSKQTISEFQVQAPVVYVLGNETEGVSKTVSALCTHHIQIPMNNGVESLNVAVTASLLAFRSVF